MVRKVIEDGDRRVILDRDEVIIEQNGESVTVKNSQVEHTRRTEHADEHSHVDSTETAHPREHDSSHRGRSALRAVLMLVGIAGISVVAVLVARIALLALEADATNQAVQAVYDVTAPLIEPFEGIFNVQQIDGGGVFEPAAAIAAGIVMAVMIAILMVGRLITTRGTVHS